MTRGIRVLRKLLALGLAFGLVAAGLVLGRGRTTASSHTLSAAEAPEPVTVAPAPRSDDCAREAEGEEVAAAENAAQPAPESAARTQAVGAAARPQQARPSPKPLPRELLPPFQPAPHTYGDAREPATGPPPGVLWLSGVIEGDPRVALLRRDENRYLVKEGDTFENRYQVLRISSNSVTLQRGGKEQRFRVGQY